MSVNNNSPSQDYTANSDDHSNHNIDSPGFKPFTVIHNSVLKIGCVALQAHFIAEWRNYIYLRSIVKNLGFAKKEVRVMQIMNPKLFHSLLNKIVWIKIKYSRKIKQYCIFSLKWPTYPNFNVSLVSWKLVIAEQCWYHSNNNQFYNEVQYVHEL